MMQSTIAFANQGGKVLGVCNGFQILCESGLLPGVLLQNANQQFICKNVYLMGEEKRPLMIPIAHGEGRYHADDETMKLLIKNEQIIYRYCDKNGNITEAANPNGSAHNIAGICNSSRNVFGMMPHPERACAEALSNTDGKVVFNTLLLRSAKELIHA